MARSTLHLRRRPAESSAPAERPQAPDVVPPHPPRTPAESPQPDPEGSNATRSVPDPQADRHPVSGQVRGGSKPRGPYPTGKV